MANYNDYQLEEMENSAVEKSSMAKRAAAAAGLVGAGAATAYGATRIIDNSHDDVDKEAVTTEDLTSAAQAGAVDEQSMNQTAQTTQAATEQPVEEVHVHYHNDVVDKPVAEEEPEMEFQSTTHWYDDEGNQIGQTDDGTYDGKSFTVLDVDNDGHGDYLAYDVNGDGVYQENEITNIDGYSYAMGHGEEHYDRDITTGQELTAAHEPRYDVYGEEKEHDIADIHNDFEDEKAGEEYGNDLAQHNPDYRNDEDLGNQYSAGMEKAEEYAYVESGKYDDGEIVEEKYELTPEETENELAYDTTEASDSQDYALDDTSDIAYDDTESVESDDYVSDETSDMAYDESQPDDMAQYDIV